MTWKRLPDRRPSISQKIEHHDQTFSMSIGFCPTTARPLEVFGSSPLVGSNTAALVSDACVRTSPALQSGLTPSQLAHSLTKQPVWGEEGEQPASVVGGIVEALAGAKLSEEWDTA